jgi:glycosyltransferase involved in cell wall biosynthesis
MRIAIVTDAWRPQINGVVVTLSKTGMNLEKLGHEVFFVTPEQFRTIPCPTYKSIHLALFPGRKLANLLDEFQPEAIHIATEGTLGLAARKYCRQRKLHFTTSFHTQFPEYIRLRAPVPLWLSYTFVRWFHSAAEHTLVPTRRRLEALARRNFKNLCIWTRGVDTELFRPRDKAFLFYKRPIAMYVGRVAVEKNIEAFLGLDLPGTKVVVGDGPDHAALQQKYPDAIFTGFKVGEELASHLASADVFVFPSLTDTFGLVLLEAMACGVPVAAFPVPGPMDVVQDGSTGILHEDLKRAVLAALDLNPDDCRAYAEQHSWMAATEQFAGYMYRNDRQTKLRLVDG